jgi:hypothetical protein
LMVLKGVLQRSIQARNDVLASHSGGCAGRPGHAARVGVEQGYLATVDADILLIGGQIPTTAWAQALPPGGNWTRTMAHYNRDPLVVQSRTNAQHQDALAGWSIA